MVFTSAAQLLRHLIIIYTIIIILCIAPRKQILYGHALLSTRIVLVKNNRRQRYSTHTLTLYTSIITSDFTIGGDELRVGGEKLFESVGIRGNNNNNNNHNRNYYNNNRVQYYYYTLRRQDPRRARKQVDKSQWQTPRHRGKNTLAQRVFTLEKIIIINSNE